MRHLRGADAEGERAQRAVGRGVGIAAHQGQAGLGDSLLRPDDMGDALPLVAEIEQDPAACRRVLGDRSTRRRCCGSGVSALLRAVAQHIVVRCGEAAIRTPELELAAAQLSVAAFRAVVHRCVDRHRAGCSRRHDRRRCDVARSSRAWSGPVVWPIVSLLGRAHLAAGDCRTGHMASQGLRSARASPWRPSTMGTIVIAYRIFLAPFHALRENPTLAIERDMELVPSRQVELS